jgi:hypothetical protein
MDNTEHAHAETLNKIIQGQKIPPPERLAATLAILSPLTAGPWGSGQPWRDPTHRARVLAPFVPRLVRCRRNHDIDQQVACRFADYVVRIAAPAALDRWPREASILRSLSPIVDRATAMFAVGPAYEASKVIPRFIAGSTARATKAVVEEACWSANYAGGGDAARAAISAGISAMKCVDFERHARALLEILCECHACCAATPPPNQGGVSTGTGGVGEQGQNAPEPDASRHLIEAAEKGDVEAQVKLGVAYRLGQGCPQDDARAVQWYRRAAEQGNDRGQTFLAFAYAEGRGLPKDMIAATAWYRRAAEQGNAIAQRQLAIAYINGDGVQQSALEAVKWYRLAAEQGDTVAQIGLGILLTAVMEWPKTTQKRRSGMSERQDTAIRTRK